MTVVRFCIPLLLVGILARGEEKKGAPPARKGKDSPPPAAAAKTAGSKQEAGAKGSANLEIPAALPDDARKALETAVEAYRAAEKAEKNRDKAVTGALSKLKGAQAKAPETALPHFYIAKAHELKRNFTEARKCYEKALKLNPRFHEAITELAGIHYLDKDKKKALELYEKALAIDPKYLDALRGKAWVELAIGDIPTAKATFETAQKVEPDEELKRVIERLDKDIQGPGWTTVYTKETENYVVICQSSQEYADEIGSHAELIRRAYNKIFSNIPKPDRKYKILVYANRDAYLRGGAPPMSAGYFDTLLRKLVIYKQSPARETLSTLYHEAFHQFLQDYQEQAPQWFNEGLGDYFGAYEYAREGKRELMRSRPDVGRLNNVQAAIYYKKCPPAAELMVMTQQEMYEPSMVGIHYAQAWAMIYFMIEGGKPVYKTTLMNYFKALQKGMDRHEAYAATFGKLDMQKFDAEWKGYVANLGVKTD